MPLPVHKSTAWVLGATTNTTRSKQEPLAGARKGLPGSTDTFRPCISDPCGEMAERLIPKEGLPARGGPPTGGGSGPKCWHRCHVGSLIKPSGEGFLLTRTN